MTNRHLTTIKEDNRRDRIVIIIGSLAICVLLAVATSSWIKGDSRVTLTDVTAALALAGLLLTFKFSRYKQACKYIGVAVMYSLYLYLFLTGASGGTTYMWHYTFPFFAIFLIGASHGTLVTLALFIPVFFTVITDSLTPDTGYYSVYFATRFIPSVSVALVFAYLFEKERDRFQQQALKAYREQEQIIDQRSRELTKKIEERDRIEEKLRQSQKLEAIGTMASGVAHDLNNILSGVVTYPELLRKNLEKDSKMRGPLKLIEDAGKRAAAVVNDLLTLARDSASVKEPSNIHTLINEFIDSPEWQSIAGQHPDVTTQLHLNARQATILCSQSHIRKCLMNLLLNGIEATSPKGTVTLKTENRDRTDEYPESTDQGAPTTELCITVRDDGQGIPADHLSHIFEPFYTTKKMGRSGSGLGLSVVWNTVEEHGGTISTTNTNPGVKFSLRFPLAPIPSLTRPAVQDEVFHKSKESGSILVIDDEPHLRAIAREILEGQGYMVTTVATGEEGLAHIEQFPTDLVILDMILGDGLNGLETYQKMIKQRPDQRAIIVSGYSTSEDVRKTLELGAHTIIKKPYTIRQLSDAVRQCLTTTPFQPGPELQ